MTGTEFLKFMQKYRKLGFENRQKELLERFEVNPQGMKQKIGIVAAFMHDPAILILDEPTSGLDPLMQSRFVELIEEEKKRGKTILMSSHMFEEVEKTCQRIGIIRNGKLMAVDSVDELRKCHVHSYTVTLDNMEMAKQFANDFDGIRDGQNVTVSTKPSLEQIFMHYYGGESDD